MQLTHYNSNFNKKTHAITLVCDNITNAPNIGSLFRIADAFGIENIIFCGDNIPIGRRMTKTSRSTEKYVNSRIEENISNVVEDLKVSHHLIALEITENSKELTTYHLITNKPIALILGDEVFGVSEQILNKCDDIVHINMFGNNSSMNVVQATAITLYELTRQLHL